MKNYESVQVGWLCFLDSSSLLNSIAFLDNFKYTDSAGSTDDVFKKKLAYTILKFNLENINQPLNLTKEDYWSTFTESFPC